MVVYLIVYFFDDYNGSVTHESVNRFNKFLYQLLVNQHTNIGTKICCYSTWDILNIISSGLEQKSYEYIIDVPKYCNYAKGDKMYIPVIKQTIDYHNDSTTILDELKEKLLYPQNEVTEAHKKFHEQVVKAKTYFDKPKSIYCNLMVIDNFYINAKETRDYILTQEFKGSWKLSGSKNNFQSNPTFKGND